MSGILISRSLFTSLFKWSCIRCDFCGSSLSSPTLFARFVCSGLFEIYTPLNLPSLGICPFFSFKLHRREERSEIWLFQSVSGFIYQTYISVHDARISSFHPRVNFSMVAFLLITLKFICDFLENITNI